MQSGIGVMRASCDAQERLRSAAGRGSSGSAHSAATSSAASESRAALRLCCSIRAYRATMRRRRAMEEAIREA